MKVKSCEISHAGYRNSNVENRKQAAAFSVFSSQFTESVRAAGPTVLRPGRSGKNASVLMYENNQIPHQKERRGVCGLVVKSIVAMKII